MAPACRGLAEGLDAKATADEVLAHAKVRERFSALLASFNKDAAGSSGRIAPMLLMDAPPSIDTGEMTDKGSINQRAVLANRNVAGRRAIFAEAFFARDLVALTAPRARACASFLHWRRSRRTAFAVSSVGKEAGRFEARAQRPTNTGLRFSTTARVASRASSVAISLVE